MYVLFIYDSSTFVLRLLLFKTFINSELHISYMAGTRRSSWGSNQVQGLQKVVTGFVGLITLWLLMYVFEQVIVVVQPLINDSTTFSGAVTLLDALPNIIGLLGGIFLIMYVISGFRQVKA